MENWIAECAKLLQEAEQKTAANDSPGASRAYEDLSRAWLRGSSHATTSDERKRRMDNSIKYRELAIQAQSGTRPKPDAGSDRPGAKGGKGAEKKEGVPRLRAELENDPIGHMLVALVDSFAQDSPITWDDIGGLDALKKDLKRALSMAVVKAPAGVKRETAGDILLYGPPGTGKTILAAALANSLCLGGIRGQFYNVRVAGLKGHYQGNTEKSISLLYEMAAAASPSLVFFDEIDGLATSRSNSQDASSRAILSVILNEMDGMATKGRDLASRFVLTVAATNLPWELDTAIISRFGENRVYVPPPDASARRQILEKQIIRQGYQVDDLSLLDWLAEEKVTKGYSGRDLRNLTAVAKNRMELEMNGWLSDWQDLKEVSDKTLKHRPLTRQDFERVRKDVPPSLTETVVADFVRWTDDPTYRPAP